MTELQKRNYEAVKSRGLITDKTTDSDFMDKLDEEVMETYREHLRCNKEALLIELGDVINTCNNWLIFMGYDPENILQKVLNKNEKRNGKTTTIK